MSTLEQKEEDEEKKQKLRDNPIARAFRDEKLEKLEKLEKQDDNGVIAQRASHVPPNKI
jgi:hypothetical protein